MRSRFHAYPALVTPLLMNLLLLSGVATAQTGLLNLSRTAGADQGPGIAACTEEPGWFSLFDGTGASVEKYFFNPSGQAHGSNSRWWVQNGILYSDQNTDRTGGVIFTKRTYKNVEMKIDIKPYWGNDAGIFFRSNTYGRSYQVVVDYLAGATKAIGGVWGESGLHSINYKPYGFNSPFSVTVRSEWYMNGSTPERSPALTAADWNGKIWFPNEFNWVRGRIYNEDVPWIDSWINGYQMINYRDNPTQAAQQQQTGHIGLQVHTGSGNWSINNPNQYRAVLVRVVQANGQPLASYPEWEAACPTSLRGGNGRSGTVVPTAAWVREPGNGLKVTGESPSEYVLTLSDFNGKVMYRSEGPRGLFEHRADLPRFGIHLLSIRVAGHTQSFRIPPAGE
jgi:hypothetical protein